MSYTARQYMEDRYKGRLWGAGMTPATELTSEQTSLLWRASGADLEYAGLAAERWRNPSTLRIVSEIATARGLESLGETTDRRATFIERRYGDRYRDSS